MNSHCAISSNQAIIPAVRADPKTIRVWVRDMNA